MPALSRSSKPPRIQRPAFRTLALTFGFIWFLSIIYFMGHNTTPAASRWIGWQKDEPLYGQTKSKSVQSVVQGEGGKELAMGGNLSDGPDYGPSFPLDQYAPIVPNPAPLTDIEIRTCLPLVDCTPPTNPETDSKYGKWVKVDRALDPKSAIGTFATGGLSNLFKSLEQKFIFYRRSRRSDVRKITEIKLVEEGSERPDGNLGWHRVKNDLRTKMMTSMWGKEKPLHLYFKTFGGKEEKEVELDSLGRPIEKVEEVKVEYDSLGRPIFGQGGGYAEKDALTELDIMYGPGPAFPGFTLAGQISPPEPSLAQNEVSLLIRRKPIAPPPKERLKFNSKGKFKILQLSDLHFSVGHEVCREVGFKDCVGDDTTLKMISRWLDEEKPDLVVFSGDQLNGQGTSWDVRSVLPKVLDPVISRKIPWTAILGNHDAQSNKLTRRQQVNLLSYLPYSYVLPGPLDLQNGQGSGNYYVNLYSPFSTSATGKVNGVTGELSHLFTLYFLDSGDLAPKSKFNPFEKDKYDFIHKDQIQWFLSTSEKVKATYRPFMRDGEKDLDNTWKKRSRKMERKHGMEVRVPQGDGTWDGKADQGRRLEKPAAMAFIHIPLPEAFAAVDKDSSGKEMIVGERKEKATSEGAQSEAGFFDALIAQKTSRDVKVISHGHNHLNSDCRSVTGIWICFNGGSSFAGYGLLGLQRRARVFEITDYGEKVRTYHRLELGEDRLDETTLYDGRA